MPCRTRGRLRLRERREAPPATPSFADQLQLAFTIEDDQILSLTPKSGQVELCCLLAESGSDFELDWTAVPIGGMHPFGVIEAVDV